MSTWNFLVFSYQASALDSLVNAVTYEYERSGDRKHIEPWQKALIQALLSDVFPKLLYPLAGWLADAKLGRYKVMRYSLWTIWVGAFFLVLTSIIRYTLHFPHNVKDEKTMEYTFPLFVLTYFINIIGIAGFHVNLIPFGIDQMEGASGEQISSFLHWYFWTRNFNFGVLVKLLVLLPHYCDDDTVDRVQRQNYTLVVLLVQMLFITAALCLDFFFSSKLHKDMKLHNPVKKVKAITAFMIKHDRPVGHRSAFTFTNAVLPTRADFAKKSYGGPFEEDEVEEVTAYWRIVVILLSLGSGVFLIDTVTREHQQFEKGGTQIATCSI